jgi:hypothetical protein
MVVTPPAARKKELPGVKPVPRRKGEGGVVIMRKVLLLLVVLVVGVIALGWYLEWFHFGITRHADTGKIEGKLEIDQDKIKADAARAKQKLGGTSSAAEDKTRGQ